MTNEWLEISLDIPAVWADVVSAELHQTGCCGVVVEQRQLDTFVVPDPDETDADVLTIRAYFVKPESEQSLLKLVRQQLQPLEGLLPAWGEMAVAVATVAQQDWSEGWKQYFSTTRIGRRLVIRPSWEDYTPTDDEVVLTLDPGMAFGTGTHGTTHLCLLELARLFEQAEPPQRLLDVGTGSGILAMAAAALGAVEVIACDIDAGACAVARENIAANGLERLISVTAAPLSQLDGSFDVIVANILAEENIRLAPLFVERLNCGGTLILSGILAEKVALVSSAFAAWPLEMLTVQYEQEWACMVYRHRDC